jgi:hypothetical protein
VPSQMLAARNRVLTAWMRRPWPVAFDATLAERAVLGDVLRRLPRALARRRAPSPEVEAALSTLSRPVPTPYPS